MHFISPFQKAHQICVLKLNFDSPVAIRTDSRLLYDELKLGGQVNSSAFIHSKFSFAPKATSTLLALDCNRLLINSLLSKCYTFVTSPVTLDLSLLYKAHTLHKARTSLEPLADIPAGDPCIEDAVSATAPCLQLCHTNNRHQSPETGNQISQCPAIAP